MSTYLPPPVFNLSSLRVLQVSLFNIKAVLREYAQILKNISLFCEIMYLYTEH